jgi:hypothetical protein
MGVGGAYQDSVKKRPQAVKVLLVVRGKLEDVRGRNLVVEGECWCIRV